MKLTRFVDDFSDRITMDIDAGSKRTMLFASFRSKDFLIDIVLMVVITALSFRLSYHLYFFGDELRSMQLAHALEQKHLFLVMFSALNLYKPRLLFHFILISLYKFEAPRSVHAAMVGGCMIWINLLLYGTVRRLFGVGRILAWMLIATVLTSRYGMMLYFDYFAGLIELLSTALLLSALLAAWLAWNKDFNWRYASGALIAAILCGFVHERHMAGLLAVGLVIAVAEWFGPSARRRLAALVWALSLGVVPLFLFWTAMKVFGSMPITTGTNGLAVRLGWDTVWRVLTYAYNVVLGGNYGYDWLWGYYTSLNSRGNILGIGTAICTIVMIAEIVSRKGFAPQKKGAALGLAAVVGALIVLASLPASDRQEARWMFPVGILVEISWIIMLKDAWRHIAIGLILATNLIYLSLGSYDFMYQIRASRSADCLAESLHDVMPAGRRGIVVGSPDDWWWMGGDGDVFSRVNFKTQIRLDAFWPGRTIDPSVYDFGLIFNGFGPHRVARYRIVPASTALVAAGVLSVDDIPVKTLLGSHENWSAWQWNAPPIQADGAVRLRPPGQEGFKAVPASNLDGRLLVYRARAKGGVRIPMRLQVNWHKEQNNRFLSATIKLVYPTKIWKSFAIFLSAPADADVGEVYATLADGARGLVELKSVELK